MTTQRNLPKPSLPDIYFTGLVGPLRISVARDSADALCCLNAMKKFSETSLYNLGLSVLY